jgi:hypothetical protein
MFKYFNPLLGIFERKWYGRTFREIALQVFSFFHFCFPKGRHTYKNLKPIDYSKSYRWRWDFHFWAYPVADFPTVVLPAFLTFLKAYKADHPEFDEMGIMTCYQLRTKEWEDFKKARELADPENRFLTVILGD